MRGATLVTDAARQRRRPGLHPLAGLDALRRSAARRPRRRGAAAAHRAHPLRAATACWRRRRARPARSRRRTSTSFQNIGRICEYVAENFREDIDSTDIALSADIHPKYAMSVFKKSTGMTLNEYVSLLRLSYAQALLMREDANVLQVAMD